MSALSNYAEGKLIDHLFRTASFAKPATLYFALFTTIPGEDGAGGMHDGVDPDEQGGQA